MAAYEQQIVIDLEFNPTAKPIRKQGLKNEIVEIGAVRLDSRGQIVDTFSCLVSPQLTNDIAAKITALTGIRTCDVSDAPSFAEAMASFAEWIGDSSTRIVTWSKNDRAQIESECAFKGIEVPDQLRRWLDLQVVYPRVLGVGNGRKMRLSTAADWYGAEVDSGKVHRALYDARVTAELMRQIMTGDYAEQRRALEAAMKPAANPLSSKLGDVCSSLEALKTSLLATEAQFAA